MIFMMMPWLQFLLIFGILIIVICAIAYKTSGAEGLAALLKWLGIHIFKGLKWIFTPIAKRMPLYAFLFGYVLSYIINGLTLTWFSFTFGPSLQLLLPLSFVAAWFILKYQSAPVYLWTIDSREKLDNKEKSKTVSDFMADQLHIEIPKENITITQTPVGLSVLIRIPPHHTREQIQNLGPIFREHFQAVRVAVDNSEAHPGYVRFNFVSEDILAEPLKAPAPILGGALTDASDWLTVGVDTNGDPIDIPLFLEDAGGVRYLIAGMPGSGKNSTVTQIGLAATKLGPQGCRLWLADPKSTEFSAFREHAEAYADNAEGIIEMLEDLAKEMRKRQQHLAKEGRQTWSITQDGPPILLLLDELSDITLALNDNKLRNRSISALENLTARSRSSGISLVFITQTPTVDVIPTTVRSNLDIRIGHKVMTPVMSDVVMPGSSSDGLGAPHEIVSHATRSGSQSAAGVFYIEGLTARLLGRAYFIPSKDLREAIATITPQTQPKIYGDENTTPTSATGPQPAYEPPIPRPFTRPEPTPGLQTVPTNPAPPPPAPAPEPKLKQQEKRRRRRASNKKPELIPDEQFNNIINFSYREEESNQ